jgi:uncharacterized protein (DUF1684 family)
MRGYYVGSKAWGIMFMMVVLAVACTDYDNPPPQLEISKSYKESVLNDRAKKDSTFTDPAESPLDEANRKAFTGLHYYPFRPGYVVPAVFKRTPDEKPFIMETTGPKKPEYVKYGMFRFELHGKEQKLTVYQNLRLKETEEYKNHLFVPFTDQTSGETTYGGGRYIDLERPLKYTIRLDFNKAYNPYCVYNYTRYDCPIPPAENRLSIPIRAGEKDYTLVNEIK